MTKFCVGLRTFESDGDVFYWEGPGFKIRVTRNNGSKWTAQRVSLASNLHAELRAHRGIRYFGSAEAAGYAGVSEWCS